MDSLPDGPDTPGSSIIRRDKFNRITDASSIETNAHGGYPEADIEMGRVGSKH